MYLMENVVNFFVHINTMNTIVFSCTVRREAEYAFSVMLDTFPMPQGLPDVKSAWQVSAYLVELNNH